VTGHLVRLHERWAIWPWIALRGAGMPIAMIQDFPSCVEAADQACDTNDPGYCEAFNTAVVSTARRLREVAGDPAFREAVTWQNRHALHTGIDVLRGKEPSLAVRTSKHRQKEALVARYLQRYCAKNDTIGFFGPVGWARAVDSGPPISLRVGDALVSSRTTFLEGWGVERLAELIAEDESILPWLPPRLLPFVRLEGSTLHVPLAPPIPLGPEEAAVLAVCDGQRSAREIAELTGLPEDVAYGTLRAMRGKRRIAWKLEVPSGALRPDQALREVVAALPVRKDSVRLLAELEARRQAVADAAGRADAVDEAIGALEDWFSARTGDAGTRRAGQTYAGRTLVYEDCRRDLDVELGPGVIKAIGPPLELVLESARWFTHRALDLFRDRIIGLFDRLGQDPVPLAHLWLYAQDLLFGDQHELLAELGTEVRERWAKILDLPAGHRHVTYSVARLRPAVLAAFDTEGMGPIAPSTRYCCPDIMIAAPDTQAIKDNCFDLILGETHVAINTLTSAFFGEQHPDQCQLQLLAERDLPQALMVPVLAFSGSAEGAPARMRRALVRPWDYRLVFSHDTCGVTEGIPVPIGELWAERSGTSLVVRSRGGRLAMDIMDVLGEIIMITAHREFDLLPEARHTPRVTFGRLTVTRERWRFQPTELTFAWVRDERERYLAVRCWKREHDLPRHVFVQASRPVKPVYADLDSPLFVDLLARSVRAAKSENEYGLVTVSEMLPTPDQAWLPGSRAEHYTSEFRFVAIDIPQG
jgi:Lantibiotic dehydratase, N terminus